MTVVGKTPDAGVARMVTKLLVECRMMAAVEAMVGVVQRMAE